MKKIASRKGGWPAKDRKDVMIRPERKLLEGVDKLAARAGASRSRLIEDWLGVLVAAMDAADGDAGNVSPEFAAESVGWALMWALRRMGLLNALLVDGIERHDRQQRELIAYVRG